MWRVKLCGIRSVEDLAVAVAAGADAVGFLVGLTHFSEDELDLKQARELVGLVPPTVAAVLVTHFSRAAMVGELAADLGVQGVQLQGEWRARELAQLRQLAPGLQLLKTLHVPPAVSARGLVRQMRGFEDLVTAVHLDSKTKDRLGGTGVPLNWAVGRKIVADSKLPVILAGGLNPGNIERAIEQVRPFAVDVNSGVDDASGAKSLAKCAAFVEKARALLGPFA